MSATPIEDTPNSVRQLWTPEKAAAVVDAHVSTLYRYIISEGFPPPVKIGKRASRFVAAEVEAWIADRAAERSEPNQLGASQPDERVQRQRRLAQCDDQSVAGRAQP